MTHLLCIPTSQFGFALPWPRYSPSFMIPYPFSWLYLSSLLSCSHCAVPAKKSLCNKLPMMATVSTCRWNWCTRSFSDRAGLMLHVEQDHIANAVPVKRKDVLLLQRVEDGVSLEGSYLGDSSLLSLSKVFNVKNRCPGFGPRTQASLSQA